MRLFFSAGNDIVSADETAYLTSGLNLWSGHGFTTLAGNAETHFPPGLPFVLGGLHEIIGGDPHNAWSIITVVSTTLVLLPLAGMARLVAGRRAARAHGLDRRARSRTRRHPAVLGRLLRSLRALPRDRALARASLPVVEPRDTSSGPPRARASSSGSRSSPDRRASSTSSCWSPCSRSRARRLARHPARRRARSGATRSRSSRCSASRCSCSSRPYASYLHDKTGKWELTAKTEGVSLKAWRAVAADNRQVAHAILYKPVGDGYEFPARESLSSMISKDPPAYLAIVNVNIGRLYRYLFNASLTPFPNWPLLPGAAVPARGLRGVAPATGPHGPRHRRRDHRPDHHHRRVLRDPALPHPVGRARRACSSRSGWSSCPSAGSAPAPRSRSCSSSRRRSPRSTATSTAGCTRSTDIRSTRPSASGSSEHSEPDDLIMSTNIVPGYYAQRNTVPIPWAQPERIVDFGRHYGVRYLIADQAHGTRFRPQLRKLLARHRPVARCARCSRGRPMTSARPSSTRSCRARPAIRRPGPVARPG